VLVPPSPPVPAHSPRLRRRLCVPGLIFEADVRTSSGARQSRRTRPQHAGGLVYDNALSSSRGVVDGVQPVTSQAWRLWSSVHVVAVSRKLWFVS
jgi:hypothetical protein